MNIDQITEFALLQAGITEGHRKDCRQHDSSCECDKCKRYSLYLRIKETIEDWERFVQRQAAAEPAVVTPATKSPKIPGTDYLDEPLTTVPGYDELGIRIRKTLQRMEIKSLRGLLTKTEEDLLAQRDFATASLERLNDWLNTLGVELARFVYMKGSLNG